jgi:predicted transposase YbfD/YdcC
MRCIVKKTVEQVIASGSDLLCQVKSNQPKLYKAMRRQAKHRPAADHSYACDIGQRNRIEQRHVRVWALPPGSGTEPWHDHFHSLIEVRRSTEVFDTTGRRFVARADETPAYYVSTLSAHQVPAREFAHLVRQHWAIENRLHHVLDTSMAEDASRIRCNPGVFACLRHLALNLLRSNGERNISQALWRNALSLDRVLGYAGVLQQ